MKKRSALMVALFALSCLSLASLVVSKPAHAEEIKGQYDLKLIPVVESMNDPRALSSVVFTLATYNKYSPKTVAIYISRFPDNSRSPILDNNDFKFKKDMRIYKNDSWLEREHICAYREKCVTFGKVSINKALSDNLSSFKESSGSPRAVVYLRARASSSGQGERNSNLILARVDMRDEKNMQISFVDLAADVSTEPSETNTTAEVLPTGEELTSLFSDQGERDSIGNTIPDLTTNPAQLPVDGLLDQTT